MLHEVLIVLAGHESPLVTKTPSNVPLREGLLHKSEQALLAQVAVLGELHRQVATRIKHIHQLYHSTTSNSNSNSQFIKGPFPPSSHAIASTIDNLLLRPFRTTLVELEREILSNNSRYVGGNKIVSLSMIVSETVGKYERRFRYSESLLNYLVTNCIRSCFDVLTRLEKDKITGYEDVKQVVNGCISQVHRTWIQQLCCWCLYGRLPRYGVGNDFMVVGHHHYHQRGNGHFELMMDRVPPMCTEQTAKDIYSIGNSMSKLRINGAGYDELIKKLELPITEAQLSQVMSELQTKVYKEVVAEKLPLNEISKFLIMIKDVALLGNADFMISLLLNNNNSSCGVGRGGGSNKKSDQPQAMFRNAAEAFIEDYYSNSTGYTNLTSTFHYISVKDSRQQLNKDKFDDLLTGIRCKLILDLEWPYSILISEVDQQRYTFAFSFLIALAKAHSMISNLWRIRKNQTFDSMKLKIVLDGLWDYAQNIVISSSFESIVVKELNNQKVKNEGVNPQQIINKNNEFLTQVCRLLFLDNENMRICLRNFLTTCFRAAENGTQNGDDEENVDKTMRELVNSIEQLPEIDSKVNLLLLKLEFVNSE